MDAGEVARLVEELKLTKEAEETVITIEENEIPSKGAAGGTRFDRFVVGKFFVARVVNRESLRTQIPRILQTRETPDIEIVGDNLFVVVFTNDRDRKHALLDGPWHFFENLMIFKEPRGMEKPSDIRFDTFTTWIQCHNLPIACMNPIMVRKIAGQVGAVEEVDEGERGNCLGQYARARVARDITKPLQRCVSIESGEKGEKHMILIRYERLPTFCSACGRVGHDIRHCEDDAADKIKKPFGVWLKASRTMDMRRGRGVVVERKEDPDMSSLADTRAMIVGNEENLKDGEGLREYEDQGGSVGKGNGEGYGEEEGYSQSTGGGEGFGEREKLEEFEAERTEIESMEVDRGKGMELRRAKTTKQSPGKKKKKEGRKEWKRRAREGKGSQEVETGEGEKPQTSGDGKRKGGPEGDLEFLAPPTKVSKITIGELNSIFPTAETAMQSR